MSSRSLVKVWSKFRPDFDTGGVEVWCRSLVDIWSTPWLYNVFHEYIEHTSTKLRHWGCRSLVEVSTHTLPNFDTGVEVWSKFLPNFDTNKYAQFWPNHMYNYDPWIFIIYQIIFIALIKQNTHFYQAMFTFCFIAKSIHNFDQQIYAQFCSTNIHNFDL